jgi:hypothetical protein
MWIVSSIYRWWYPSQQGLGRAKVPDSNKESTPTEQLSIKELKDKLKTKNLLSKSTQLWDDDHPYWIMNRVLFHGDADSVLHWWRRRTRWGFTQGDFHTQHRNRLRVLNELRSRNP